ncbi:MAG: aminoglycoside N(3)-acetyltransferase [Christensenellales bacterium]
MMPTQSWKNLDPETGVHGEVDEKDWPLIRENWPAYDKKMMPTNTMGAVAEMFRQWPGSVRSDHPARSICAWGKNAAYLTQNHDLSDIFGESSPLAKLYALNGKVLLLGTGYNKNTSMHLADVRAEYAGKHMCIEHSAIWENGKRCGRPTKPCSWMARILSRLGRILKKSTRVRMTQIGNAAVRLMRQRELVDYAVTWMEKNRV